MKLDRCYKFAAVIVEYNGYQQVVADAQENRIT